MKDYHEMTDDEFKAAVKEIVRTSNSDDEVKRRLCDELGYPYSMAISSMRCGSSYTAIVMVWAPSGKSISI